ncbi:MAG: redoxin family protein [Deltaproteobacteria bacterium]|nr:redoxin family protein [Deltaproteobacteria bacterium]
MSPDAWGPTYCAAAGEPAIGFAVGDQIGNLPVKDCDTGATVSIEEACGAKATWIFAAHTHCPTCRATADFTAEVAASVADQNVAVLHIVHDDSGISCPTWRERYELVGLPNVKVYADPSGAAWSALKTSNYTAPSAFLDARRVITYKAHGLTRAGVQSKIEDALAR